jgi:hypothetical protein
MKATLLRLWITNRLSIAQLEKAVRLGWITQADADEIAATPREET